MTFLNIDPNLAFVVQGVILIGVLMSARVVEVWSMRV